MPKITSLQLYFCFYNLLTLFFFRYMFPKDKKQEKQFISYSKYLRDRREKQMEQIKKIKSINTKKEGVVNEKISQNQNKDIKQNKLKGESDIPQKQSNDKQKWVKIDQKAVIVNGKLVYIQEQNPPLKNVDQLLHLLNSNQVRIKEYIYGDKKCILDEISNSYENKKKEEVEKYINKNMKQQHIISANCSEWYNKMKYILFDNQN